MSRRVFGLVAVLGTTAKWAELGDIISFGSWEADVVKMLKWDLMTQKWV